MMRRKPQEPSADGPCVFPGRRGTREGAGTLLFVAFVVLVVLVVMALSQWFAVSYTRSSRVFNQQVIARTIAESAMSELMVNFIAAANSYKDPGSGGDTPAIFETMREMIKKAAANDDGEPVTTEVEPKGVLVLADPPDEDKEGEGGYGLKDFSKEDVVMKVILREKKIADVDRHGVVVFLCAVKVGSCVREYARYLEYYRYHVVPPYDLGKYSFIAMEPRNFVQRWRMYAQMLCGHAILRRTIIDRYVPYYVTKSKLMEEAHTFFSQVRNASPRRIAQDLDRYRGMFVGDLDELVKKMAENYDLSGNIDENGELDENAKKEYLKKLLFRGFSLPYVYAWSNIDPSRLQGLAAAMEQLPITADSVAQYDLKAQTKSFKEFPVEALANSDLLSDPGELSKAFEKAFKAFMNGQEWLYIDGGGEERRGGKPLAPVYSDKENFKSVYYEFHDRALPGLSGGQQGGGDFFSRLYGMLPPICMPHAKEIDEATNYQGIRLFLFSPAELGLDESIFSNYEKPEAAANQNTAGSFSPGVSPSGEMLDVARFERFRQWWSQQLEAFKNLHLSRSEPLAEKADESMGQVQSISEHLKFAGSEARKGEENGKRLCEAVTFRYIFPTEESAGKRCCYKFKSPEQFYEFINHHQKGEPKDAFKLCGFYYIDPGAASDGNPDNDEPSRPASELVLEFDKYAGCGIIATTGDMRIKKDIKRFADDEGNLILMCRNLIYEGGVREIEASVVCGESIKPADGAQGDTPLKIKGNLIVRDMLYGPDGERLPLQGDSPDPFCVDKNNSLPPIEIVLDEKLQDKDGKMWIFVASPFEVARISMRGRQGLIERLFGR